MALTKPLADPLESLPGSTIADRYRVFDCKGVGDRTVMFRGYRVDSSEEVAIQVLRPDLADQPDAAARFDQAARTAAQLDHPHCMSVLDHGVTEDPFRFMVIPAVQGRKLSLALRHALPPSQAVGLAIQILRGLEYIHELGIVHRDLNPDHVFVVRERDGREVLQIVDFGVAKLPAEARLNEGLSPRSAVVGTPAYMSPEQAVGSDVDGRADLYSLGVLLQQMLTGELPFEAPDARTMVYRHLAAEPRAITVAGVPNELRQVVARLLAKTAARRFTSAEEVIDVLTPLAQALARDPTPWTRLVREPPSLLTAVAVQSELSLAAALAEQEAASLAEQDAITLADAEASVGAEPFMFAPPTVPHVRPSGSNEAAATRDEEFMEVEPEILESDPDFLEPDLVGPEDEIQESEPEFLEPELLEPDPEAVDSDLEFLEPDADLPADSSAGRSREIDRASKSSFAAPSPDFGSDADLTPDPDLELVPPEPGFDPEFAANDSSSTLVPDPDLLFVPGESGTDIPAVQSSAPSPGPHRHRDTVGRDNSPRASSPTVPSGPIVAFRPPPFNSPVVPAPLQPHATVAVSRPSAMPHERVGVPAPRVRTSSGRIHLGTFSEPPPSPPPAELEAPEHGKGIPTELAEEPGDEVPSSELPLWMERQLDGDPADALIPFEARDPTPLPEAHWPDSLVRPARSHSRPNQHTTAANPIALEGDLDAVSAAIQQILDAPDRGEGMLNGSIFDTPSPAETTGPRRDL